MGKTQAGGAATINGIEYQILWSLLQAIRTSIDGNFSINATQEGETFSKIQLILEPKDGGDAQVIDGPKRIVTQLKAKSDGGTWSLREFLEEVIPDLYLAVDANKPDSEFEFVTEGRIGQWGEVYKFFRGLSKKTYSTELKSLDNSTELIFSRQKQQPPQPGGNGEEKKPFWNKDKYTQKDLFEKIIDVLKSKSTISSKNEDDNTLTKKLWLLLSSLTIVEEKDAAASQKEIDLWLMSLVNYREGLSAKREELVGALIAIAKRGSQPIIPTVFFTEHGLDAIPWDNIKSIGIKSKNTLKNQLERFRYDIAEDVSDSLLPECSDTWLKNKKNPIALRGDSGNGKSWKAYRLAHDLAEQGHPVLLFEATGDTLRDIREIERIYSVDIIGQDHQLSLKSISDRLKSELNSNEFPWLYLIIDALNDQGEARKLGRDYSWNDLGIALVVFGTPAAIDALSQTASGSLVIDVNGFSDEELKRYLSLNDEDFYLLAEPFRKTLSRPLVSSIYRKLADAHGLQTSEYVLFDNYWNFLFSGSTSQLLFADVPIKKLALSVLEGKRYPWSADQLISSGFDLDGKMLAKCLSKGLLREFPNGKYGIWHDRFLSWTIAYGVASQYENEEISDDDLASKVEKIEHDYFSGQNAILGYVPFDLIWLLTHKQENGEKALISIISVLDRAHVTDFFQNLVNEIGTVIIEPILKLVDKKSDDNQFSLIQDEIAAVNSVEDDASKNIIKKYVAKFFKGDNWAKLQAACLLMKQFRFPEFFERLWQLAIELEKNPKKYDENTSWAMTYFLERTVFNALKAWSEAHPDWLKEKIQTANDGISTLGYVLASLPNTSSIWTDVKQTLLEKLPKNKLRSFAINAGRNRDRDEIQWLQDHINSQQDSLGAAALNALLKIDPQSALHVLDKMSLRELAPCRHWCLYPLLILDRGGTNKKMLDIAQKQGWAEVIRCYSDFENLMSNEILKTALDGLENDLNDAKDDVKQIGRQPLGVLANITRLSLLSVFESRKGSDLERLIEKYLIANPNDSFISDQLISILKKIGGRSLEIVTKSWLRHDDIFQFQTIDFPCWIHPDEDILQLLESFVNGKTSDWNYASIKCFDLLVSSGIWKHVISSIFGLGNRGIPASFEIAGSCLESINIDDFKQAIDEFDESAGHNTKAIHVFAILQKAEYIPKLIELALSPDTSLNVNAAIVSSLCHIKDRDHLATDVLINMLDVPELSLSASSALLFQEDDRGLDVFIQHLNTNFDYRLVKSLISIDRYKNKSCLLLKDRINKLPNELFYILQIFFDFSAEAIIDEIMDDIETRSRVLEKAFSSHICNDKYTAILVLERTSKEKSLAALENIPRCFNPISSFDFDNQRPYILERVRLLGIENIEKIIFVIAQEPSTLVKISLTHVLFELGAGEEQIIPFFEHDDVELKSAALFVAGYLQPNQNLISNIRNHLQDIDPKDVITRSAQEALYSLEHSSWISELVEEIHEERDAYRRWCLLDSLIHEGALQNPEDDLPEWYGNIIGYLPMESRGYIIEKIDERRKKILGNINHKDDQRIKNS